MPQVQKSAFTLDLKGVRYCRASAFAGRPLNPLAGRGVLPGEWMVRAGDERPERVTRWPDLMNDVAALLPGSFTGMDSELAREFEARLTESSTLAFRVAYGVLRHREDAEDVAQEACVKAYRNFRHLRDRDRFRAWLVRMTWRLALDRQRSDRRRAARDLTPPVTERVNPTGLDDLVARERAEQLWQAIDALPEKLRVVVVLSGIEDHDVADVARLVDLPEGTVKSRLFLARQRLREQLQCTMNTPNRR
jgi:RNA polymerase sigma factor (sigma-70 family)